MRTTSYTVNATHLDGVTEQPLFKAIATEADIQGIAAFAIGGYVRDLLINRPCKDLDFVVEGDGIAFAEAVAKRLGTGPVHVFKNFGTAMFMFGEEQVEFVGARKESYSRNSRKPEVESGSIKDDQERRDFTINALAISLNKGSLGALVDPFGGILDLDRGLIRTPLDPDITFSDDPLRMLRAVRFASQLGFTIDPPTFEAIKRNAKRLEIISAERIHTELNKIIAVPKPSVGFNLLLESGLLQEFFPEFVALQGAEEKHGIGHKDNFHHTLQVLDNVCAHSDDLWLRWGAILHDIAKPLTKRFEEGHGWTFHGHEDKGARMVPKLFRRLKLPLDDKMRFVQKLVALHLRPISLTKDQVTDSAIRRLLFDAGDDIDALMILCRADITSKNEKKKERYLKNYDVVIQKLKDVEQKDHVRNFQPPVTGEDIMAAFNIPPCKIIGDLKTVIKDAILDGKIHNDRGQAWELMIAEAAKLDLAPVPGMEHAP
ncbi:MAG: HD domain-containing protein [Flavobacteriales bacterium]|nr:HD domain-containing protein [Flavobacteriales bacterium]MBK6945591.1 HD domain-containing protein [Flavobacteriales bacterium]MBK7241706.1 HD domain-containing protein [Flavobacteriales bacterium]MBP9137671.1 HD domain-containing protein [Flavobacteriales bacterium]HQV53726.1 HD domain-containing protein [Flavobacteriales bacterium]